jgi:bifunctional oligoribonuclease and PAP phosphatase NrnA
MPIDWSSFPGFVARHQKFLLMTHIRPDGDAIGSEFALADGLRRLGKEVRVVIASNLPSRYQFLDPDNTKIHRFRASDVHSPEYLAYDAIIVVDTGTWNQLGEFGEFMRNSTAEKAVIDHHITQDPLSELRYQDTSAESCARLVHEAIQALKLPHTQESASAVFLGLAMDTGWFHHNNTSAESFALAAELCRSGADAKTLYANLYEQNTLPRLKLMARVLERLQVVQNVICYSHVLRTDYAEVSAAPGDTEDFIEYPRGLAGCEVAMMFMEQPQGGVKVSLRSRGTIDVSKIAERFGGGGHKLACGCTLNDPLASTIEQVVKVVQEALA